MLLLASGCGSSSSSPSASSSPGSNSFSSYLSCLRQHGVTVPTARPSARPTGGTGGSGGGFGGTSSTVEKARQACASLRPTGGFGGFGGGGGGGGFAAAFRSCMASHGETIPTTRPTAPPTSAPSSGTDRFLNGLNPSNPKVAAAVKACQSKLPTFGSGDG